MNDPSHPLGPAIWRRGAALGLVWVVLFAVVTLSLYVLMAVIGWSGTARALCAMGAGPVLGTGVIVGWWVIRRPVLAPPDDERGKSL
jgi:Na+/serine symporter